MALALFVSAAHAQPPALPKSYFERVEQLQDRVDQGSLPEIEGVALRSGSQHKTAPVAELNPDLTWWQYDDDTTFIHLVNRTGAPIAGLKLAFWVDSCAQKAKPPTITYVALKTPVRKGQQAVVTISPNPSLHTRNDVSCLQIQGAWSP